MKKIFYIILFLMIGALISGCSDNSSQSASLSLPDTEGKEITFEKMDQPALVFFFTGVG